MIRKIRKLTRRLLNLPVAEMETNAFLRFAPPGHFYSPIPDMEQVKAGFQPPIDAKVGDVDLNEEGQMKLLMELARLYPELPYPAGRPNLRYTFDQNFYCYADAIYLHGILRHFQPRKIIEVGSGHSSAMILDTNELFLKGEMTCTFIEPYPDRLLSTLRAGEKQNIHLMQSGVQNVSPDVFSPLAANDILFIDSSHVSKYGSDVNYLMFEILPVLKPGVIVHIHDIFYPFEYPKDWLLEGRAWNEAYLVRAFLQHNHDWEVLLFADFAGKKFRPFLATHMPLCLKNTGCGLWICKRAR